MNLMRDEKEISKLNNDLSIEKNELQKKFALNIENEEFKKSNK